MMSHFTVLVVTDDVPEEDVLEVVLQPWHEYECTGIDDEYVVFVPAEEKQSELDDTYNEAKVKYDYTTYEQFMTDYYGYSQNDDGFWGRVTNPNSKWDWWAVGARWSNSLKCTDKTLVDSCQVSELDVKGSKLPTFAYVIDNKWYERGEMGWWACVSNEKDPKEWEESYNNMINNLTPEQWVTVIDCHI